MIRITQLMVLVFAISGTVFAEMPYKESEALLAEIATLEGKVVSVHGLIDKLVKDGISSETIIVTLDGGLKCRISRDAFKNIKTGRKDQQRRFTFKYSVNGVEIDFNGKQILNQGTDVIIRGTVKKEMNAWIIDRAVIKGCSDPDVRNGMDLTCGGPCSRVSNYDYYDKCTICRDK